MIKFKQIYKHDPDNDIWGDCGRAVIGCLLEIHPEYIPHFFFRENENGYKETNEWLEQKYGLNLISIPFTADSVQDALNFCGGIVYNHRYMLLGTSKNNCNHVVICKENKIIHDTALDNSGIIGPSSDGHYWLEVLTQIV